MLRPEIMELKSSVKTLKRDAALRLSLDAEAQQSFDFLSEQLHGLRRAFSTLSDVFVEEVDSLRAEQKAQAQALRSARAEVRRLKGEAEARAAEGSAHAERLDGLEARVERASGEVQALARDAGKASSSCHLLQLDLVEQRSAMDSRLAEQRKSLDEAAARLGGVSERVEAHVVRSNEARESLYAEVASLRQATSAQLGAHATAMEQAKQKLLLLAQAVETQHSASKAQQGRVDALASAGEALS
ncbi:hypothetical protein EMIHUDRAFT_470134, partial [Emiliania huxleyi CCMP1516]|uniref:Uncharacterized protein n=2 Tax=Emiliania huxleyi TaxID=2903 RepID=A0A0D3J6S6_EMIH1